MIWIGEEMSLTGPDVLCLFAHYPGSVIKSRVALNTQTESGVHNETSMVLHAS